MSPEIHPETRATLQVRTTMCSRDCPDVCAIDAHVAPDGRVVRLTGNRSHPITRGFLCERTSRFVERQNSPERITRPRLQRDGRTSSISLESALDLAAEKLAQVRAESGPASIFYYASGGSLGILKGLGKRLFDAFGPVTTKRGDICSGAGDAAQAADFGDADAHDPHDALHARHIICWGRNLHVSNVHLLPIVREARARGTTFTVVDPACTRTALGADDYLQVRPGGDAALALAVGQVLFERGWVAPDANTRCAHLADFRTLCERDSIEDLAARADVSMTHIERLAERLADGPTAIWVGWGLQRRAHGSATIRLLDALCAISGNLGVPGGGVAFSTRRRRPFDTAALRWPGAVPPRTICEPLLGEEMLAASDPPIRAMWITCANPVAMLPDSQRVAEAIARTEFVVALDAFETDTTRRATLVLPVPTLLEDDDLLGSYGHHYVGVSRPVTEPPPGVVSELALLQMLAARLGLAHVLEGSARDWKARLLAGSGLTVEALEQGAQRPPNTPAVRYAEGAVPTADGRVQLITDLSLEAVLGSEADRSASPMRDIASEDAPLPDTEERGPFWLLSNSTAAAQGSMWSQPTGPWAEITVHPSCGLANGSLAEVRSRIGALQARVRHDAGQRPDVVLIAKGGHFDRGQAANALIEARLTDAGEGAAYLDCRVGLTPLPEPEV